VVEFDQSMQKAVISKRFHHQWLPDQIDFEKGAIDSLAQIRLTQKGYKLVQRKGTSGRVDAILLTQWGYYEGGADPRGDDTKIGW